MAKPDKPLFLEPNLSLRPLEPGKWQMRIYKPDKKKILRGTLAEATAKATQLYQTLTAGVTENPTVSEAIQRALTDGKANEETLARYTREANRFLLWFKSAYPGVVYWQQVRPSMVQAYANKLHHEGRAADSVRLAVFPLRKTSLFWNIEYPRTFDHITRKLSVETNTRIEPKALTLEQLETALAWLKENRPVLYPIVALAGYMGMRLREPTGILNSDVDLQAGTIRLKSNHVRKLKNEKHAPRTVPLTAKAREAIEWHMAHSPVKSIHPDEPLFLDDHGNPWHKHHFGAYCRQVKKSLCRAVELPKWFAFQKSRATFNTLVINAGAREAYADRYQGRRPLTVGREHYLSMELHDLQREIADVFDRLTGYEKPISTISAEVH